MTGGLMEEGVNESTRGFKDGWMNDLLTRREDLQYATGCGT